MEFDIANMRCGHCASMITKTVKFLDPEAEVAVVVRCLPPALGERQELVAEVDERHPPGPAAEREIESVQDRAALADALAQAGYPTA